MKAKAVNGWLLWGGGLAGVLIPAAFLVLRPLQGVAPVSDIPPPPVPSVSIQAWQAARADAATAAQARLDKRLLFTPGRRPRPVMVTTKPKQAALPAEPKLHLQGTVLSDGRRLAILVDPSRTDPLFAGPGDRLTGGWTVARVDHGSVSLEQGGRIIVFRLMDESLTAAPETGATRPKTNGQPSQAKASDAAAGWLDPTTQQELMEAMRSGRHNPD